MVDFCMGDADHRGCLRCFFRDLGESSSQDALRIFPDLGGGDGDVFDVAASERVVIFCCGGAPANSDDILVFAAGTEAENQVTKRCQTKGNVI